MSAKNELRERLIFFDTTFSKEFLQDKPLSEVEHNGVARLLRKGLGILAFNILEDFIRKRIQEVLHLISTSAVTYENLPEKLQNASTIKALDGLLSRARNEKNANKDWKKLIREETLKISKTSGTPFELSSYSLGWASSNLSVTEISDILSSLGVHGGWQTINTICMKIKSTLVSAEEIFKRAAERRHDAAHDPESNYLFSDLRELPDAIITLCAAIDILIYSAYKRIKTSPLVCIDDNKIKPECIHFCYLKPVDNKIKLYDKTLSRASRIFLDLDIAISNTRARLDAENKILIILNDKGIFKDWFTD